MIRSIFVSHTQAQPSPRYIRDVENLPSPHAHLRRFEDIDFDLCCRVLIRTTNGVFVSHMLSSSLTAQKNQHAELLHTHTET